MHCHSAFVITDSRVQAIANMTSCEHVYVRTPTGPGGMSGPLRCLHFFTPDAM